MDFFVMISTALLESGSLKRQQYKKEKEKRKIQIDFHEKQLFLRQMFHFLENV